MPSYDKLVRTARDRLDHAHNWARQNDYTYPMPNGQVGARIMVGEFNVPTQHADTPRWNTLLEYYLHRIRQYGMEATAWASGGWSPSYHMALHTPTSYAGRIGRSTPTATVLDRQPGWHRARGHNVSIHEHDGNWPFPDRESWIYLRDRGVRFVRLPFKWGNIQPNLGGGLSSDTRLGLPSLQRTLKDAQAAGIQVFLDCHTYMRHPFATSGGAATSGSREPTPAQLSDLWVRLHRALPHSEYPALVGFDLMNEPHSGTTTHQRWHAAAQRTVDDLRAAGFTKRIYVSAFNWGDPADLPTGNLVVRDRSPHAMQTWYTIHTYFNAKEGFNSTYRDPTYNGQLAAAGGSGFSEELRPTPPAPSNDNAPWEGSGGGGGGGGGGTGTNPTISFRSPTPAAGATCSGTVTIEVAASAPQGLDHCRYSIGDHFLGQAAATPFRTTWDTTRFPDGQHTIFARAVATDGKDTLINRQVTVANGTQTPTHWADRLPTVKRGDRGNHVRSVQGLLVARGHAPRNTIRADGSLDGAFGSGTENAVKALQRAAGLTQSGAVNARTWRALLNV